MTASRALSDIPGPVPPSRPIEDRGGDGSSASAPASLIQLVTDGRMPPPRPNRRVEKIWDVVELDIAFDALPRDCDKGGFRTHWADR